MVVVIVVDIVRVVASDGSISSSDDSSSIEMMPRVSESQTEAFIKHISGGHGSRQMVPSVLMYQVKRPHNLCGGYIDKMLVYLADKSRMFAINDHNLLVNDLVTNNQLNNYIVFC
uniref:Uncharacterized protein n=1 Tax=Octopus bimaculoides TaxID=37653 RepID=A0A0L8HJU2_OCTBM